MATQRRPRGSVAGSFALFVEVDPEANDIAKRVAATLGVTKAQFVEELLLHVVDDLDDVGIPTWWTKPTDRTGELDLAAS